MKLTYRDIPSEVKQIANASLGVGVLRTLLLGKHTYQLILKVVDGILVGFSLYHIETRGTGSKKTEVGVFDCVCVSPAYRKEGFGTLLTLTTLRKMSAFGVDRIELKLKSPLTEATADTPGVPILGNGSVLEDLGFTRGRVKENAYRSSSRLYSYSCALCGQSPDSCASILYVVQAE